MFKKWTTYRPRSPTDEVEFYVRKILQDGDPATLDVVWFTWLGRCLHEEVIMASPDDWVEFEVRPIFQTPFPVACEERATGRTSKPSKA